MTEAQQVDRNQVVHDFNDAVNMSPAEIERWLESEDSQSVGRVNDGDKESVGHQSGRRIVQIKRKSKAELTEDDIAHMRKVVGYVHRHMAQRPKGDISDTRWRYSLMNWGHDPLKHGKSE
jgi:hypothetical protein